MTSKKKKTDKKAKKRREKKNKIRKHEKNLKNSFPKKQKKIAENSVYPDEDFSNKGSAFPFDPADLSTSYNAFIEQFLNYTNTQFNLDSLLNDHPNIKDILSPFEPVNTASIFGAMLLDKRLQSNCIRLEALVHLAITNCEGTTLPTQKLLVNCFNELDEGICGRLEDPAEDVFVSLVTTKVGNFRVLEGIWESSTFYLQRILDIVQTFPDQEDFNKLRIGIFALLKMSEAICHRANLSRYCIGAVTPRAKVSSAFCSKKNRKLLFFDAEDLAQLGIHLEDLEFFIFNDQLFPHLSTSPLNNSPIHHYPLFKANDQLVLVLPTAVSVSIRSIVIDFLLAKGHLKSLQNHLADQYAAFFHDTNILGSFSNSPIDFVGSESLPLSEFMVEFDKGHFINFIFIADKLEDYYPSGLVGLDTTPQKHFSFLEKRVHKTIDFCRSQSGFIGGITLLVHCGVGRSVTFPMPNIEYTDWEIQFLPAPDLFTLSCFKDFNVRKFSKILEGARNLEDHNIQIINLNGLFNLIAWVDENEGHLIPHSQVPKSFRNEKGDLFIAADFVRKLRHKIAIENDFHGIPTIDQRYAIVQRDKDSLFSEDKENSSTYLINKFSDDHGIPFVYVSESRYWWCHIKLTTELDKDRHRWSMLKKWLPRIIISLEPILDSSLPMIILLNIEFPYAELDWGNTPFPTKEEIEKSCSVTVDTDKSTATVIVGKQFELGLAHSTNISERALIISICQAFVKLASTELTIEELNKLESTIVKNDEVRMIHAFNARKYRDFVLCDLQNEIIEIDNQDVANLRNGLAFRTEKRINGRGSLRSKNQCTQFLNKIVRSLEDEICTDLQSIDRAALVEICLRNHEQASAERSRWMRTARANFAIHDDHKNVEDTIVRRDLNFNAVLFPSRVLIELALCECPSKGGLLPDHMDLSKLMTKVNAIWQFGGWSDAIYLDAMPHELTITPLGDIQADRKCPNNC